MQEIFKNYIPSILRFCVSIFIIAVMIFTLWSLVLTFNDLIIKTFTTGVLDQKKLIEEIFYTFIMIEILFMGIKYFEENFHIPIRYFFYIVATTLTKDIFINPDNALVYTGGILLTIISLWLYNIATQRKKEDKLPTDSLSS